MVHLLLAMVGLAGLLCFRLIRRHAAVRIAAIFPPTPVARLFRRRASGRYPAVDRVD